MSVLPEVRDQSESYALLHLVQGAVITQAISVAARLGIADVLADGPLSAPDIAARVGSDARATHRVLRALTGHGVFAVRPDGRYEQTPLSDKLREDATDSMRGFALLMNHPTLWEEWGHLYDTVESGEANLPKLRGMGALDFFHANPGYAKVFFEAFGELSTSETDPILAAYDFSGFGTVVDVIAGRGNLLAGILGQAPDTKGVLYDSEVATVDSPALFEAAGVADRLTIEHGGYLGKLPAGADAYLFKHIIHDFSEADAVTALRNAREAIAPGGRLLVLEYVLPENNEKHIGHTVDLWLMLMLGARERTRAEYAALFAEAGFELTRVVPTGSPISIVEGIPV
ncbi:MULTISPECIES: methyltransferase [Streptomyces]|uniref:methyltransferase n=1 Tax=Streptomyces TaxID=1883 RepID=UPI001291446B|nr:MULTISPECIES: methyltransferase [Streptomyces]MCX5041493.1 acetylserotonin O-methyltransferase [Streptomyces coelicoflavus]MDI6521468.1 methyltransferase [Streptomyces coelicoflavus]QFX86941.1 hydroxyneurosporene methyltransferase [Streptomyces sp. SYP-A7193]